jgi:hypothetical protein
LWDNMWTAEEYFNVKIRKNNSIWKINQLTIEEIYKKLSDYNYIDYLKNITKNGEVKQSYINLLLLSNLLKKYDKKIPR